MFCKREIILLQGLNIENENTYVPSLQNHDILGDGPFFCGFDDALQKNARESSVNSWGGTSIRFTLKWFFEEFVSTTGKFNWKSWMFHGVLRSPLRYKEHLRRALAAIEKDQRAGQENSFSWCCVQIFGKLIVSRGWYKYIYICIHTCSFIHTPTAAIQYTVYIHIDRHPMVSPPNPRSVNLGGFLQIQGWRVKKAVVRLLGWRNCWVWCGLCGWCTSEIGTFPANHADIWYLIWTG